MTKKLTSESVNEFLSKSLACFHQCTSSLNFMNQRFIEVMSQSILTSLYDDISPIGLFGLP